MVLVPTILRIVFPITKETGIPQWLLKRRRIIGIIAFLLAFAHGFILVKKREIDFFDFKTFRIYLQGIFTFAIFLIESIHDYTSASLSLLSKFRLELLVLTPR